MCNLGEGIYEDGLMKGKKEGKIEGKLELALELVNVLPPIEAGASCFNENSATDSKELRRLTLSPQA